jgi:hypothetical protein
MRFIVIGGGCYGIYHSGQLYKAIQKGKLPADSQLIVVDRNADPRARQEHGDKPGFSFVQSDWQEFLQTFFSDPARYNPETDGEEVQIVPAPFAPHLLFDWLRFSVTQALYDRGREDVLIEREGFDYKLSLPFESTDKVGNHYISRAGWMCPTACIEPRLCPAIKGPRDWDLDQDVRDFVTGHPVKPSQSADLKLSTANVPNGATTLAEPLPFAPGYFAGVETFTCHHFSHGIGTTPAYQLFNARARLLDLALSLSPTRPEARVAIGTVSHCHGVLAAMRLALVMI